MSFLSRHRSVVVVVLLMVVAGGVGAWWNRARVDRSRVYRIGYGNDRPLHFVGADGAPTGLAVELVREAARRKGIQLEWVLDSGFNQARMDLWVLLTIRTDRPKTAHLTEPYLRAESSFLVAAGGPIRDVSQLARARVSHISSAANRDIVKKMLPESTSVPCPGSPEALQELIDGRVDAAFLDQYALFASLLRGERSIPLRVLPNHTPQRHMALAARYDTAAVAEEIRDGMKAMVADGTIVPLVERWVFIPNLTTDVIGELAEEQRHVRWLVLGIGGLSTLLLGTAWLAVAARRSAGQARRTETLLRKIADRVPGVVFQYRLRPDGTACFPYASEALRQMCRVSPEEVREDATKVLANVHPDDLAVLRATIQTSARDLTPWLHEYRVRFADGTERWHLGNAQPQREADGSVLWHGFISDVTEQKAAAAALLNLERKIQETQKLESLGVLAGGIAHDFNNLLTGILGNSTLAGLELPAGSPVQTNLESIRRASLRAADLCKQMLAYSGKGRFLVKAVGLNGLVEETTQLLKLSISKQAVLRFNLAPNLPAVEGDATQLRQVIMNLVINASEAIGAKSGVISINTGLTRVDRAYLGGTILAPELKPGTYVYLEVSDNGHGMDADTQAKIFDPFFTTKFTGRGLGLAAVLGIVRGHKGALKVYSEVGRGTTFKILLPCAEFPAEPAEGAAPNGTGWRGQGTVLVVDDEETVRSTAALVLKRLGFDVALAADGREAVEIFRATPERFALVLMDLTMPHLDGAKAFTELRRLRSDVCVVLMSGFNEEEAISQFAGKGLGGFLQKPFQYETLSAILRTALEGRGKVR
ncbi:MAG: transporter substrate-binding domain-containing protein [Verrucomicrobia bacterium]|nr:transporter substrate-binding domain-containing protein [Verrucomicrobiota bacterium]